ncbi:TetR/AcrR family transcriptional regulator [Georgenia sp. 311]|uniref:TetR/AcrR family transcriptional regulator n=1 Tax=Georgenia sp. 311 TaxID=2585134 RepID=UPI0011119D56|nr:TetR/AcrR family transcriptional regulator [Georgenia sp. 311]TNC20548.1 TetR/AcrR family transcriptional regulator [Georgenia sp. 311]
MAGTSALSGREQLLAAVVDHLADHSVDGQSLRSIAAAVGTSHRMLIYHFGSREGLLAAVVGEVERLQREAFTVVASSDDAATPREVAERFWEHVVGPATRYGPLFFELSAHAMQGRAHAQALATGLVGPWLDVLAGEIAAGGIDAARARTQARLGLATVRGLLFDLLVTGDRTGVDDAYRLLLDLVGAAARPDVPVPEG